MVVLGMLLGGPGGPGDGSGGPEDVRGSLRGLVELLKGLSRDLIRTL